jgi:ribosome biogenesis GTPase
VIELHGQRARLSSRDGIFDAVLSGKLRLKDAGISPVAVGDFVEYIKKDNIATIENVIERKSYISRPAVERESFRQVLISNVDRLVIVTSLAQPRFNHGIVERFLVIAFKEEIQPVVVLNKIDLGDPSEFDHYLSAWKDISCLTFHTSAKTGEGIDWLKEEISSGTSVIVGHSGVGKSSILNRISPDLNIKTAKISSYSRRGVHTTSKVSLYKISDEGWIADTPGLKILGFGEINKDNLQCFFPDFQIHLDKCRFNDCSHIDEPSCGVKDAVISQDNSIAKFRYESYKRIYKSL